MAGEIKAEYFFFVAELLPFVPFGHVGQAGAAGAGVVFIFEIAEQALLARPAIRQRRRTGLQGSIDRRHQCRAPSAEADRTRPALIRLSIAVRLHAAGSMRAQKSNKLRIGPPVSPCRDDRMRRVATATFNSRQAEGDLPPAPSSMTANSGMRTIHIRRQHFDFHPQAIFAMLDQRIFLLEIPVGHVAGEQGRHEFDRIMGLEIGRDVGDQGVSRRMAFVESVAGEMLDQAEQFRRLAVR